jgi:hypothetical protein
MRLFTITASIISFVVGIAGGEFLQSDREGLAFWCGKIQEEERVQHTFNDWEAVPLPECQAPQRKAEAYAKGEGTVTGSFEKVVSSILPRSWASTPQ